MGLGASPMREKPSQASYSQVIQSQISPTKKPRINYASRYYVRHLSTAYT